MTEVIESRSEKDTFALGQKLGGDCRPGDIVLLNGDLGVGKTVFTKGFGKGLGIEEPISSPTFTIMQIYESGRLPLYHFDVYRIADPEEMDEIGYKVVSIFTNVSLSMSPPFFVPVLQAVSPQNDMVNIINRIFFITLLFNLSLQIYHFRLNPLTFVT